MSIIISGACVLDKIGLSYTQMKVEVLVLRYLQVGVCVWLVWGCLGRRYC